MKIIGLTGSIAAGKSTVAGWIRDLGIAIHDADAAVHELLSPHGVAVNAILAEFETDLAGHDIGNFKKGINRQALGNYVFARPQARQTLESILHPLVRQHRDAFLDKHRPSRRRQLFWMCLCCLKPAVMLFVIISSLFMPARKQRRNAPWHASV